MAGLHGLQGLVHRAIAATVRVAAKIPPAAAERLESPSFPWQLVFGCGFTGYLYKKGQSWDVAELDYTLNEMADLKEGIVLEVVKMKNSSMQESEPKVRC